MKGHGKNIEERSVIVHGQKIQLYRVRSLHNSWCSDLSVVKQIEEKQRADAQSLKDTRESLLKDNNV